MTDQIPIGEIGKFLPWNPNPSTVWRWRKSGVNGVRLEVSKIGGRVFVSKEQVDRFVAALSAQDGIPEDDTSPQDMDLLELEARALGI